jgi:hypothetical protein
MNVAQGAESSIAKARAESIHMENHIFVLAPISGNVSGIRPLRSFN